MRPVWVTRGIGQLIRQFCARSGNAAWIGIASADIFGGRRLTGLFRDGGSYQAMPGISLADGLVWTPAVGPDDPELWLAPTKTGYRAIFESFAQRYLHAPGLAGADVQIDHVFPKKAGALDGLRYVRMLAIPPESNMAAGRTLERAMVERGHEHGGSRKLVRMASYFAIGKATGFTGYQQLPDDDATIENAQLAQALIAHLRNFGLPDDVLGALDQRLTAHTVARLR